MRHNKKELKMKYNGKVLKGVTDTQEKWIYIMNTVSKLNKANKDKKVRGPEVLVNTYFRAAYPVVEVLEDGKYLLQLHYHKKDKYLSQTVHKQDTIIKFLKKITKKDFVLQGFLFEEGHEKCIYDEMDQEIDYDYLLEQMEEDKRKQQVIKQEEQRLNEQEQLYHKKQEQKKGLIIDPFGGGFIGPDNDGLPF